MIDDSARARVRAQLHALSLNWDADKRAEETESPLARLERLSKFYKENPCVASELLLKAERAAGRLREAQPGERSAERKA